MEEIPNAKRRGVKHATAVPGQAQTPQFSSFSGFGVSLASFE
jgi:hypothetical protein